MPSNSSASPDSRSCRLKHQPHWPGCRPALIVRSGFRTSCSGVSSCWPSAARSSRLAASPARHASPFATSILVLRNASTRFCTSFHRKYGGERGDRRTGFRSARGRPSNQYEIDKVDAETVRIVFTLCPDGDGASGAPGPKRSSNSSILAAISLGEEKRSVSCSFSGY